MTVVKRLEEIIKDQNLSYVQLGQAANKTPQSAHGWIKTGRVSRQSLELVADKFGYSRAWLLTGEGDKYPRIESSESFSPDEMALLQKYRQLGDDQKKATQTMVDAFNQPDEVRKVG